MIRLTGKVPVAATRERVWAFVTDPAKVGGCAPDMKKMTVIDDTHYEIKCGLDVGIVGGAFNAKVEIRDKEEPGAVTLFIDGMATSVMFDIPATMLTALTLTEESPATTLLSWNAELRVGKPYEPTEPFVGETVDAKLIVPMISAVKRKVEAEEQAAAPGAPGA
jgi:uncharacterized protein